MSYVAVAYLVVAALFVGYTLSLISRQRMIADLADAVVSGAARAAGPPREAREPARGAGDPPAGRPR